MKFLRCGVSYFLSFIRRVVPRARGPRSPVLQTTQKTMTAFLFRHWRSTRLSHERASGIAPSQDTKKERVSWFGAYLVVVAASVSPHTTYSPRNTRQAKSPTRRLLRKSDDGELLVRASAVLKSQGPENWPRGPRPGGKAHLGRPAAAAAHPRSRFFVSGTCALALQKAVGGFVSLI